MICANAPLTIKAVKLPSAKSSRTNRSAISPTPTRWWRRCFKSRDYTEGRTAFMEKRKPVFTGADGGDGLPPTGGQFIAAQ